MLTKENTARVVHAGLSSGMAIFQKMYSSFAPSMRAASRMESGSCSQNCFTRKKLYATAILGMISAQ